MIRTIVSDLGNVLLHFDHMGACRAVARHCSRSPEQVYDAMFESDLVADYELGRLSSLAFGRRCIEMLDLDVGVGQIRDMWSDIFHPVEGMEDLVRSLKGSHTLVLLSNTNEWHFEHCLETYPVVGLFDHYALSYKLGCRKPDRVIYERALAMAGSLPTETLYFDDIPAYVEAAANLGVRAVPFENGAQLRKRLKAEGVRCP